jgi:serine/threonine protein kinase
MPSSGDRVGEYILDAQVGKGTFGEVWRARHHVWADRIVAIKVPTNPEYVRALQSEGTSVHGLEHPNIVQAINFDPYASPPYLAMEFVKGSSLRGLISAKVLSWKDSAALMCQVLAGLGYAHGKGTVHRDVKPENILVSDRVGVEGYAAPGLVKITDFGLGKPGVALAAGSMVYTASIGAGSEISGTIAYMSPEQRTGGEVDGRSDLFSCGVVLFEMLTGERPAGTELPSELNPALPKTFDDIFRRAYARLGVRYANAAEFAASLERLSRPMPAAVAGAGTAGTNWGAAAGVSVGGAAAVNVPPPIPGGGAALGAGVGAGVGAGWRATAGGVRPPCPKCRMPVGALDQFCMGCGTQLVEKVRRCGSCGSYPHPNDKFCLICGKGLGAGVGT